MATYIALFLPDTNNCFWYVYYHIFVSTIFSFCVFIFTFFHTLLTTRHILQFTMFDSISFQLVSTITELKILHNPQQKKKRCINALIHDQLNTLIFWWYKVWVFPTSVLICFFFSFWIFEFLIPLARKWATY